MLARVRIQIKQNLPGSILGIIGNILFFLRKIRFFGWKNFCPVCNSQIRGWSPMIYGDSINEQCPVCYSLERHRLDWLFLFRRTKLLDATPKHFLHIAPETFFIRNFQRIANMIYITGDFGHILAMTRLDLTCIPFPDDSFDAIYCSHVLEHIQEDCKALAELFRILKPKSWAVLQVPLTAEKTFEDLTIVDPNERKRVFGQSDHVRKCGPDYVERMRAVGFNSKVFNAEDIITKEQGFYLGIQMNRVVIYCEKNR